MRYLLHEQINLGTRLLSMNYITMFINIVIYCSMRLAYRLTSYSSCDTFRCNCKVVYYCIVFSYTF